MSDQPLPIPKGLVPHLVVTSAAQAISTYAEGLGAVELYRLTMGEAVMHAEIEVFGQRLMLADEFEGMNLLAPKNRGGATMSLSIYVEDVDALVPRALQAGFQQERPTKDEFFGDRVAHLVDPDGHRWALHQHLEDVSPAEMQRRMEAELGGG